MQAAERLEQNIPEILRQWEAAARAAVPAARRKSQPVLLDSMPQFLVELAGALRGHSADHETGPSASREHAEQRAGLPDYSLDEVVMEYSLLRQKIFEVLEASAPLGSVDRNVILDTIDLGVREAATHFVELHERALRESEERFRLLVASVNDYAIFMLDPQGHIVSWNRGAERLKGYSQDDILGKHFSRFYTEEDIRQGKPGRFLEIAAREDRIEDEGWRVRKDGSNFWANVVLTAVRDESGRLRGYAKVTRDMTERRKMEEELLERAEDLRDANRRKDEFLAMLAHELRNPLSPIRAAVEILRLRGGQEPEMQRARDVIDRQVQHLTRMVDDLLDVARITQGRIHLRKERVELQRLIELAVETVRPFIAQRQHELSLSLPRSPVWLEADLTRIAQVVANLLHNASKFTEPGGRIDLTLWTEGGEALVRVRDTGMGIDPEFLPRIFDLFAQGQTSLARPHGGLGIGLSLVRMLVELHGGRVQAHSAGPGLGSEFLVLLPVLPADAVHEGSLEPAPAASAAGPLDVLVVDDNVDAAITLAQVLRLWDHSARTVHDGPAGLEAAIAKRPDVVLLDIGLPGMDGYQVAAALRQRFGPSTPFLVALTGYGQEQDKQRSREAGFDRHLTKPVDLLVLRQLLASRR